MPRVNHKHTNNFTIASNSFIQDSNLSYKARGIFLYLWSLPPYWEVSLVDLERHSKEDGQHAVRTGVAELEKLGYLSILRVRSSDGKFTDTDWILDDEPSLENPKMDNSTLDNSNTLKTEDLKTEKAKTKKAVKSPPLSPQGENASFTAFWQLYPKKLAKQKAWEAWKKLKLDALQAVIMRSVEDHLAQWHDEQFIPHPATFLNQRRWEDDLTPADIPGARLSKAGRITAEASTRLLARWEREDKEKAHATQRTPELLEYSQHDE